MGGLVEVVVEVLGRVEVDEDEGLEDPEPQAAPATATRTSATTLSHRMRPPFSSAVGEAVLGVGSYTSKRHENYWQGVDPFARLSQTAPWAN